MTRPSYQADDILWFVLVLGGAYRVAAGSRRHTAAAALLLAPVAQGAYGLLLMVLVAVGVFA